MHVAVTLGLGVGVIVCWIGENRVYAWPLIPCGCQPTHRPLRRQGRRFEVEGSTAFPSGLDRRSTVSRPVRCTDVDFHANNLSAADLAMQPGRGRHDVGCQYGAQGLVFT